VPSVSKKQERFMQAVAHNPAFAKKAGVPQSVGKEFTKSGGGMAESKKMVKKEVAFMQKKGAPKSMMKHEMAEAGMKKGGVAKYAKGGIIASKMGAVKTAAPSRDGVAVKGKTKGKNLGNSGKNVGIMGGAKGMKKGGYC
jgi:hypothetical protein